MINKLLLVSLFPAAMMAVATSQAATVTVTDGVNNNFGTTGGVAIDFDTTVKTGANWEADLTTQLYSVDSVSLRLAPGNDAEGSPNTATVRLGVYSILTGTGGNNGLPSTLGGFLGVSTNEVTLTATPLLDSFIKFDFSGVTVTPQANAGSGSDVLYFIFQTDANERTDLSGSTSVAIRRLDAETGSFVGNLAAILQNRTLAPTDVRLRDTRVPEYSATITPIPEPTALSLLGIAGLALVSRRRRQS